MDPLFAQPFIDIDEWRDAPVRHRYVHGGFTGTEGRFVFCFPPKEQFQGRFFHYVSPVPMDEDATVRIFDNNFIGFCADSGAYAVGTNQGGAASTATPVSNLDPTISGRLSVEAARYSRLLAADMYEAERIYGYVFGGSGGAYRTIGAFENNDVWDGAVPFVMGSPMAVPNVYTVRVQARRLLKDKFAQIIDAIEPGGGDMYAGLDAEERRALEEATKLGFPPRGWKFHKEMGIGALTILFDLVVMADPAYFEDFWTKPGYLGHDHPELFAKARVQHRTPVARVIYSDEAARRGIPLPFTGYAASASADDAWKSLTAQRGGAFPVALELANPPLADGDYQRGSIIVRTGASEGAVIPLESMVGDCAVFGASLLGTMPSERARTIAPGDEVEIDNSNFIAVQSYHRHQVPGPDYPVWDQFRDKNGEPLYPQRPNLLGPMFQMTAGGAAVNARFAGEMIVVETLMDWDALPWQADWYRSKVKENLGAAFASQYRLWYVDHATHVDNQVLDPTRTVGYFTTLQQALRDLADWVERDIAAPSETHYRIEDGQVLVPDNASERGGVQPVVTLRVNGGVRADVRAGEEVEFSAIIETPPNTGAVVGAEWDFEGNAAEPFPALDTVAPAPRIELKRRYRFSRPGTYFPALRGSSQRQGDAATPYARLQNLGRVRVVVH